MFNECLVIRWKTAHFCILNFSFKNHFVWEVISSDRHSVSSPDKTPGTSSKNTPLRVVFSTLFSVFHLVMKHCVSCLIYYMKHCVSCVSKIHAFLFNMDAVSKLLFRYYCYYYYLLTTQLSQVSSSEFAMPRDFTVLTKLKKTLDEINSIRAFPLLVHAKGLSD